MSRSSKIELLYFCVLIESLAGYAYDEKHNGRHTDGKHDDLYPHGTKHAKHDKDATFAVNAPYPVPFLSFEKLR